MSSSTRVRRIGKLATECEHRDREAAGKGLCSTCYKKANRAKQTEYQRRWNEKNRAKVKAYLTQYESQRQRPIGICDSCKHSKPIWARDLCKKCYSRDQVSFMSEEELEARRKKWRSKYKRKAARNKTWVANRLEKQRAWNKENPSIKKPSPIIICQDCKQEKPHKAKQLCGACYQRNRKLIPAVASTEPTTTT